MGCVCWKRVMAMGTGLTGVGYGWSLLSFIAAALISAGYYIPVWLVGRLELQVPFPRLLFSLHPHLS